jgi:hypothetical protein
LIGYESCIHARRAAAVVLRLWAPVFPLKRWSRRARAHAVDAELDVIAIIGIVLLIGIAKKNAIMMIG